MTSRDPRTPPDTRASTGSPSTARAAACGAPRPRTRAAEPDVGSCARSFGPSRGSRTMALVSVACSADRGRWELTVRAFGLKNAPYYHDTGGARRFCEPSKTTSISFVLVIDLLRVCRPPSSRVLSPHHQRGLSVTNPQREVRREAQREEHAEKRADVDPPDSAAGPRASSCGVVELRHAAARSAATRAESLPPRRTEADALCAAVGRLPRALRAPPSASSSQRRRAVRELRLEQRASYACPPNDVRSVRGRTRSQPASSK